ncbi:MAG: ZIP family metal transporter [Oscillospiraceae bacterium]|nr:ZIP family metal transporter [Oscillospiraceae bacterium]
MPQFFIKVCRRGGGMVKENMQALILSVIAGAGGTGLGGLFTAAIGKRSASTGCYMLSFAGGVMISVVCFGLMPESIDLLKISYSDFSSIALAIAGLILGIVIVLILNRIVDRITIAGLANEDKLKIHHTPEELYHSGNLDKSKLFRSGFLMLVVIALHNIPEGMAIGAGGTYDFDFGLAIAVMLALHNIPEGMAVATPLIVAGVHKGKVLLFTVLAGSTTLIGAGLGVLVGGVSDAAVALSLSGAGGAMLYVVFAEIIPQSIMSTKNRAVTIVALSGIIVGMIATQIY